jgi:hypothetical protein
MLAGYLTKGKRGVLENHPEFAQPVQNKPGLQQQKQSERLQTVVAAVHEITLHSAPPSMNNKCTKNAAIITTSTNHENVIGDRHLATGLKQTQKVMELTMNITANCHGSRNRMNVALFDQNLFYLALSVSESDTKVDLPMIPIDPARPEPCVHIRKAAASLLPAETRTCGISRSRRPTPFFVSVWVPRNKKLTRQQIPRAVSDTKHHFSVLMSVVDARFVVLSESWRSCSLRGV